MYGETEDVVVCPTCESEQRTGEAYQGALGRSLKFRCRCCGAWWSEDFSEEEDL